MIDLLEDVISVGFDSVFDSVVTLESSSSYSLLSSLDLTSLGLLRL